MNLSAGQLATGLNVWDLKGMTREKKGWKSQPWTNHLLKMALSSSWKLE